MNIEEMFYFHYSTSSQGVLSQEFKSVLSHIPSLRQRFSDTRTEIFNRNLLIFILCIKVKFDLWYLYSLNWCLGVGAMFLRLYKMCLVDIEVPKDIILTVLADVDPNLHGGLRRLWATRHTGVSGYLLVLFCCEQGRSGWLVVSFSLNYLKLSSIGCVPDVYNPDYRLEVVCLLYFYTQ